MEYTHTILDGGYHVEDLATDQARFVEQFTDAEFAGGAIRVVFLGTRPMSQADCDERNRIDFEGDPIYSPATTRNLAFEVTERC